MFKLLTTMKYTPNGTIEDSVYLWGSHLRRLHSGVDELSRHSGDDLDVESLKEKIKRGINDMNGLHNPHRVGCNAGCHNYAKL